MSDSDNDADKTDEVQERLEDGDVVGGDVDSDDSMVLTLDDGDSQDEGDA